jgi:SpoVK/Ycf46/Vps4 family AAA+-type ATPase
LARSLRLLLEIGVRTLAEDSVPSELARRVTGHLGCELSAVVSVAERFPIWEHVNIQRGIDAYLAAQHNDAEWFAAPGAGQRPRENMLSLISTPGPFSGVRVMGPRGIAVAGIAGGTGEAGTGAASYGTVAIGPEENTEVVTLGLVTATAPDGAPVVIGVRDESQFGPPLCSLEILAADRSAAAATRAEIERLMRVHDAFRGQVLSFTESEHHGNELVSFLPRPAVTARDVVLPDGLLETIEQHIIGIADWSQELLSAGQHLKRGLLLHGPPGTGKTHTVRYLTGRLADSTVILLTGRSIRFIDQAAALARRLQPSMVVLEDVDLVATDRDYTPDGNPLLFSLLDAMDGVGADADVTFVLTTNRADILETALADRPGRVDLAVEIPPARRRLPRAPAPRLRARPGPDRGPRPGGGRHRRRHRVLRQGNDQAYRPGVTAGWRASAGAARRSFRRGAGRDERGTPRAHPLAPGRRPGRRGTGRAGANRPSRRPGPSGARPLSPYPVGIRLLTLPPRLAAREDVEHDEPDRDQNQEPRADWRRGQGSQRGIDSLERRSDARKARKHAFLRRDYYGTVREAVAACLPSSRRSSSVSPGLSMPLAPSPTLGFL